MTRLLFHVLTTAAASTSALSLTRTASSKSGQLSRSNFISSAASIMFFASSGLASPQASCAADENNPRYIESEVQMKYGTDASGNPRTRGTFVRRFTGDSTGYTFPPPREVRLVKEWPEEPPFSKKDFLRADEGDDENFYTLPRLVYHIDEPAVASLTQYYRANIPAGSSILDICSSWVSHYPLEFKKNMKRISGTGMNALELAANDQFTDYQARNLNVNPVLPYDDNSFDFVTCVVSIDYLIHPIEVMKEVRRVLKPGGKAVLSQSNRCFPSKAIAMWLDMNDRQHLELINSWWLDMNDRQHLELINGYAKYAGFGPGVAYDITAKVPGEAYNDPMFIIEVTK